MSDGLKAEDVVPGLYAITEDDYSPVLVIASQAVSVDLRAIIWGFLIGGKVSSWYVHTCKPYEQFMNSGWRRARKETDGG